MHPHFRINSSADLSKVVDGCLFGVLWIISCEGKTQSSATEEKATASQVTELRSDKASIAIPPSGEDSRPSIKTIPDEFSGTKLLTQLGSVLPAPSIQQLNKVRDLPEMQAATLEPKGKIYVLGIQSEGGLVLHLGGDNAVIAFGFASNAGSQALLSETQQLLIGFELVGEPDVTVLDEKFNPVSMRVQTFRSKDASTKKALRYSRGKAQTVVFYDSTRLEIGKLLPASPGTMDPSVLKELRSLVEPAR